MTRFRLVSALVLGALAMSGCSSLLNETGSAAAGIAGGSLASAVTNDAGVAAGIGIAVQAGTRAYIRYGQRKIHHEAQQQIARAAGSLGVGEIGRWQTTLTLPLETEEAGRVAVSRVIASGELDCKEIVFSVDRTGSGSGGGDPAAVPSELVENPEFFVASICKSDAGWQWATAEPATLRWGSLQ